MSRIYKVRDETFKLVKVTPGGSHGGERDRSETIAVCHSKLILSGYAVKNLHVVVGKPKEFSWSPYYLIEENNLRIIL